MWGTLRFSLGVALVALISAATALRTPHPERLVMNPISLDVAGVGSSVSKPERYSGYFDLNRTVDAHMFFFYFQARTDPETAPLVIWMTGLAIWGMAWEAYAQTYFVESVVGISTRDPLDRVPFGDMSLGALHRAGGPGCSSELAVFFENGPYQLLPDQTVEERPYGWDVSANMIFVDQPVDVGFSYSSSEEDRCFGEHCVADDMLDFLLALYEARPELQGKDIFITGESYAGHYVPAVASRFFHAKRAGDVAEPIPLRGLAIGNGLTNPRIQYGAYADYLKLHGKVGQLVYSYVNLVNPVCRFGLQVCDLTNWEWECLIAVNLCQMITFVPLMAVNPGMNVYDIRKPCVGPLCYPEFDVLDDYLNRRDVQKKLGVHKQWTSCDMGVHTDMMADWPHDFSYLLPELLAGGVRSLIYAGDQDFICNWLGNRRWVDAMPWANATAWDKAHDRTWRVDGEVAGSYRSAGALTFVRVADAGHMVPMDRPKQALDMITRFFNDESFGDDGGQEEEGSNAAARVFPRGGGRKELGGLFALPMPV